MVGPLILSSEHCYPDGLIVSWSLERPLQPDFESLAWKEKEHYAGCTPTCSMQYRPKLNGSCELQGCSFTIKQYRAPNTPALTRAWGSSASKRLKNPASWENSALHNNSNHSRRKPPQSTPWEVKETNMVLNIITSSTLIWGSSYLIFHNK